MRLSLLGDLASIAGLVIAVVGFVVTIREARKAKRASEEARQAARESVRRIRSQLLGDEVAAVLQLIRELDSACRDRSWSRAVDRCDEARTRLARFVDHSEIDEPEKDRLRVATDDLLVVLEFAQRCNRVRNDANLPPKHSTALHVMITALSRIEGRLQTKATEVWDVRQ